MKKTTKKKQPAASRYLVTFELPQAAFEALQRDASQHGVKSHHQRSREILLAYLSNRDNIEVREILDTLESKLLGVAELVRRDTYAVLVHAAKMKSETANAWIRKNMSEPLGRK